MKLYYHKTDGGAEYLTDTFIECAGGHREGVFSGAKYIVRIDGDIAKDAELMIREESAPMDASEFERLLSNVAEEMDLDDQPHAGKRNVILWEVIAWVKAHEQVLAGG